MLTFEDVSQTLIVRSVMVEKILVKGKNLNNLHLMKQQQKRLLNAVVKALRVKFSAD